MREWKLRGYVSPNDFSGSDAQRLQSALNEAAALDVGRVIVEDDLVCGEAVSLPGGMHLVLRANLAANLVCRGEANFSLACKTVFIEAEGGSLKGSFTCFNGEKIVLKGLAVEGDVSFSYSRKIRMEDCSVSGRLTVARGTADSIFQNLTVGEALVTGAAEEGPIIGREDVVKNVFLRNVTVTRGSVVLQAADDAGLAYLLVDGITAPQTAVIVGDPAHPLPAERYEGLSLCDLVSPEPVRLHDPMLRTFLRP